MTAFPKGSIAAALFPRDRRGAVAFVDRDGKPMRFAEAAAAVCGLANTLLARGVVPGSRIGFLAPRGPLGVIGFLAASCIGTCCPLNPRLTANELSASLATLSISTLLDGAGVFDAAVLADRAGLGYVECSFGQTIPQGVDEIVIEGVLADPASVSALLMQTSGTTSRPKLVALSHRNILSAGGAICDAFGLAPGDLCLNPMPLYHVHGLISAALASLLAGSAVHCAAGFSPAEFDTLLSALSPTWFTGSPAMHLALREHYEQGGNRPRASLRFFRSSSAPLQASAIGALEAIFQAPLVETYGLTETASMVCSNPLPPAVRKPGSVGFAFGAEIKVVDASGATCPLGTDGEIAIRGPSTITAYAGGGDDAFIDGWLLTGDIGRMDEDGYLSVIGRAKELIKRGGLSVYPSEVDEALAMHPAVAEVATFAVPHATLGEDVVAAVVRREGADVSEAALRRHVAARLSTYKVPSVILDVPSIPKNETGKIVRRQVGDAFAELLLPKGQMPRDAAEHAVLEAWRAVLERDDIGVTDNVFLFGADPLRAGRASEKIAATGWLPTLKELLAAPTVREQVERMRPA